MSTAWCICDVKPTGCTHFCTLPHINPRMLRTQRIRRIPNTSTGGRGAERHGDGQGDKAHGCAPRQLRGGSGGVAAGVLRGAAGSRCGCLPASARGACFCRRLPAGWLARGCRCAGVSGWRGMRCAVGSGESCTAGRASSAGAATCTASAHFRSATLTPRSNCCMDCRGLAGGFGECLGIGTAAG